MSRRLKFDELRPNSRLLHSQSIYLDFGCERSRSRTGSGQRQTDSFPIANVFWEGDCFWTRGISYRNDQVAGNGPRGSKTARRAAVFDPWGPLSGGSVIGVTGLPSTGSQWLSVSDLLNHTTDSSCILHCPASRPPSNLYEEFHLLSRYQVIGEESAWHDIDDVKGELWKGWGVPSTKGCPHRTRWVVPFGRWLSLPETSWTRRYSNVSEDSEISVNTTPLDFVIYRR